MNLSSQRASTLICLFLGALAFALRLYYVVHAQPEMLIRADASQYFRIAINVVDHGVYSDAMRGEAAPPADSYRGPGYPTLIALPLALSRDALTTYWSILFLQAALGAGVAVLGFILARRWLSPGFALACGVLVAVWPHLIVQSGCLLTESPFGFLLVGGIYLTLRALESGRIVYHVAAAVAFACAALTNSMIVFFPLVLFGMILVGRGWRNATLFLLLALAPPLLWAVRDARIEAPGVKSAGGRLFENVLVGLEPDFRPSYRDTLDPEAEAARDRVNEGIDLYYRDRRLAYRSVAIRISEQPLHYFFWFLQKPAVLWRWDIAQGAGDIYIYPMVSSPFEGNAFYRIVASICAGLNPPLILAALGGALLLILSALRRTLSDQNQAYKLCGAIFLYAVVLYTVLNPDARYANPFRPFEIMMAMSFVAGIAHQMRKRRLGAHERKEGLDAEMPARIADARAIG